MSASEFNRPSLLPVIKEGASVDVCGERNNQEIYRSIVNATRDAIILVDNEGIINLWNKAAENLFGWTQEEAIGKEVHKLIAHENFQQAYTRGMAIFKETGTGPVVGSTMELEALHKDGRRFPIELSLSSIEIEGKIGVVGTVRDITERKKSDETISSIRERYEKLFESSRDSLMTLEPPSWLFTSCNSATCKMFGAKDTAEFTSQAPWELSPQYQPDGRLSAEMAKEMIDTAMKEGSHLFEWTHKRLNGEEFPATVLLTRVEIGDKAVVQATVRDITDSKRSEAALRDAERMGTIGEVTAGMAHDFNNLIQHILGCIELALMDRNILDETKEDLLSSKQALMDTAGRLKNLMRFAGKSRETKKYETLNLKSILDDALIQTRALWKDEAQSRGLTIDVLNNCPGGLTFFGEAGEMRSVLFNMIKNSVEAMPEGGVISIGAKMIEDEICLTIVDTGKGMDENTRKRVFDPFFSTKGFERSRGFGMNNVFTIIREHKGTIRVAGTEPGKGTTFEIRLPFADDKPVSQMTEAGVEKIIPARVLWVDDEKMICKVGKRILSNDGYKADAAESGHEAIKLLAENKYDLMITDVGMPGMSGYQLIEKIKGRYPDMKIAVLTGWGDSISDEEKEQRGIGRVVGKPIVASELRDLVREVMQMKQR